MHGQQITFIDSTVNWENAQKLLSARQINKQLSNIPSMVPLQPASAVSDARHEGSLSNANNEYFAEIQMKLPITFFSMASSASSGFSSSGFSESDMAFGW